MDKERLLYHITEAENIQGIKKLGLLPDIGNNSKTCGETEPRIFCCDYKSIPYWLIILQTKNPVLLRFKKNCQEIEEFEYASYQEYMLGSAISPEEISVLKIPKKVLVGKVQANKELCIDYIYSMGSLCRRFASYYYFGDESIYTKEDLLPEARALMQALYGLKYEKCSPKELRAAIRDSGDGDYAFTDHYLDSRKRLWSQLPCYRKDETSEIREELFRFIKSTFKGMLYMETGGWSPA